MENKYIWLFGESGGKTANNNSYWMWRFISEHHDEVEALFVVEKNERTKEVHRQLPQQLKQRWIWRNSFRHIQIFSCADMLFVSQSFVDVRPDEICGKSYKPLTTQPLVYLQHGTLAIKQLSYNNYYSNNCLFRFLIYNPNIKEKLQEINGFREYQIYNAMYHPRYMELIRRYKNRVPHTGKRILWFITWREYLGDNLESKRFFYDIKKVATNERLQTYLEKTGGELRIYLHALTNQADIEEIKRHVAGGPFVKIIDPSQVDVMTELAEADVLVTDYSSVGFDFTTMEKPVILYQPDREAYLSKRNLYCTEEELQKASICKRRELIQALTSENYSVNPFFRKRMPEKFDFDWIENGGHIERIFQYFWEKQSNNIAFLGYDFTGTGGTVSATIALAEGLLEEGYLVRAYTLKRMKNWEFPAGLALQPMLDNYQKHLTDKVRGKLFFWKGHYRFLKCDPAEKALRPYSGLAMTRLMRSIHARTVVSTRESLHFFLQEASSPMIKKKVYFFHTSSEAVNQLFPGAIRKLDQLQLENVIFVTKKNQEALKKKLGLEHYQRSAVIGNALDSSRMIKKNQIEACAVKECYTGVSLLRISKERKPALDRMIEFAEYLKEHSIENIRLRIYGDGDYLDTFQEQVLNKELEDIICICGQTSRIQEVYTEADFSVDFAEVQSFGMMYIESILNGKMIFCYDNEGARDVLSEIPKSFISSYEDLVQKIYALPQMTKQELQENWQKIYDRYSQKTVTAKFCGFLDL